MIPIKIEMSFPLGTTLTNKLDVSSLSCLYMRTLSKSDYLEYRACRHAFWLARHKPDLLPRLAPNDFDLMLMQDGYDVESAVRAHVPTWPDPEKLKFQKTYKDTIN